MIEHLRQLAIFAKTIDHGSFRGAANALRLSPSVVSHHISQLEDHLGIALIYRTTRKLTLTREGERLLAATRKMLAAIEGELQDLTQEAKSPSGELRITVPSVLSRSHFPDLIANFTRQFPRVSVTLDFSDQRRDLIDGGFDLAVRMGPSAKTSATSRKLFSVTRLLVATPQLYARYDPPVSPKDLEAWDWLGLVPAQRVPVKFHSGEEGSGEEGSQVIHPQARVTTNDAQALYQLARAGAGLAVVPDFLARDDIDAGHMIQVLPGWSLPGVTVSATWPANAPRHGLVHLVLDALTPVRQAR